MDRPLRLVLLVSFLSIAATPISLGNANLGLRVPCTENERQALLMFKQDLLDFSNRLSSWIGERDCCFWPGVVCGNLTGHVRALLLGDYYLGGKLNPSLLNLSHLTYLDLSSNDFEGMQIPNFFGSLTSLRHLDLSQSDFQGIIPHQLGNLSNLRFLDLHGNYFEVKSLQWISGLSQLLHLDMSGVDLREASDLFQIPQCTQLVGFDQNSYIGNELCGFPLDVSCKENRTMQPVVVQKHMGSHLLEDGWFFLSLGLGFLFGFWSVLGSLLLNMPWSFRFSQFQNSIVRRLYGVIVEYCC